MKFSIDDKVIEKTAISAHTSYPVLKVVGVLGDALLVQYWGHGFDGDMQREDFLLDSKPGSRVWREGIQRYQESELFTPEEAIAKLRRLELSKSKLDIEFEAVRNQIAEKLNQAATLVKEAGSIAKPFNRDFYDLKQECMPLYRALDDGGWSHSSMRC